MCLVLDVATKVIVLCPIGIHSELKLIFKVHLNLSWIALTDCQWILYGVYEVHALVCLLILINALIQCHISIYFPFFPTVTCLLSVPMSLFAQRIMFCHLTDCLISKSCINLSVKRCTNLALSKVHQLIQYILFLYQSLLIASEQDRKDKVHQICF